jgi:hypothetical protein
MEYEDYFDATVDDDLKVFPPLELFALLLTYRLYAAEHAGWCLAEHADLSVYYASASSIIASGAGKELDLLWEWQSHFPYEEEWRDAAYELHVFGERKVLGLRYGSDGTKCLYISPLDLGKVGYFYDALDCLLVTGERLRPGHFEW